jgi:hypothetical protein
VKTTVRVLHIVCIEAMCWLAGVIGIKLLAEEWLRIGFAIGWLGLFARRLRRYGQLW